MVARDLSGLSKAAPFRVSVGDKEFADFLELNGEHRDYRTTIVLPEGGRSGGWLRDLEIEDYAGNKTLRLRSIAPRTGWEDDHHGS